MVNKELRKLKRRELLQMLLTQCEETERVQKELEETTSELEMLQEGYERLKKKLDIKDERLNQKDAKIAKMKSEMEEMKASREIELQKAGSIAEASLRLNGIFEAAQRAAEQYLTNVKRISQENTQNQIAVWKPSKEPEQTETPEQLDMSEEGNICRAFEVSDRKAAVGQRTPYESGWRSAARRKKLHG